MWYEEIMDMLKFFLGALSAILGSFLAMRYQIKKARKIRMDEIIAERKVHTNGEAYAKMKDIASRLAQSTLENVLRVILENEKWFFRNRLYLPGKYPNKWITIRNKVSEAIRSQLQSPEKADELASLKKALIKIANEAIDEIYKEMELERIEVEEI